MALYPLTRGVFPPGYLFAAGAGALSAKHEEMPLGYPRPTVIRLLCGTVKAVPYICHCEHTTGMRGNPQKNTDSSLRSE